MRHRCGSCLANSAADDVAGCWLADSAGVRFAEVRLGVNEGEDPAPYAAVARTACQRDLGERWLVRADGSRRAYHVQAFPAAGSMLGVVFS